MKPPVNIDNLMEEWSKDSVINDTEPGLEIVKISSLRSKYLRILSHHNMVVKKLEIDYKKRRHILGEYFEGNLNKPEDLETYGFKEPCLVKAGSRSKIPMMLDSNEELNNILMRKILNQEIVNACTDIIKELHSRTFQLKAYMDWHRFMNGS